MITTHIACVPIITFYLPKIRIVHSLIFFSDFINETYVYTEFNYLLLILLNRDILQALSTDEYVFQSMN